MKKTEKTEETLDPTSPRDWRALGALGSRMASDMLQHLASVRDRKVWQSPSAETRSALRGPAPEAPEGIERAYEDFVRHVRRFPTGNLHPRFYGWVMANGTPVAMLAEMLAAGMNFHLGGFDCAGSLVEEQVISWLKELLGLPATASGLLVSGGSMANLIGMIVARNAKAPLDVREHGLMAGPRMRVYASSETHACVRKALEILGLGRASLSVVPVDRSFRVDVAALRRAVADDRRAGHLPICVVGNAGTVNTGAVDDLNALASVAREEDLWFHVDGALGGPVALSPVYRSLASGMERADSLAVDLHKWMHMPYEVGCVFVRDAQQHRRTFAHSPEYLAQMPRGLSSRPEMFSDLGVQLSRGFRALKVWMSIKAYGAGAFRRLIDQNIEQAKLLGALVDAEPELERTAPVSLNVVCFRYVGDRAATPEELDALNREVLCRLHESGDVVPSYTTLHGRYCLRVCITSHRSRSDDMAVVVREAVRHGRAVAGSARDFPPRERARARFAEAETCDAERVEAIA
jgi:aromatic-L-amino-acid/L-tryptophan decarboxylase